MRSSVPSGSKFGGRGWRRLFVRWRPEPVTVFGGEEGARVLPPGLEAEVEALTRALIAAERDDSVPTVRLIDAASPEVRRLVAAKQRERINESEVA
jgi:hypothetical protein